MPMQTSDSNERFSRFLTLATFVLVVAVLRVASEVMIPIALALLLTFLLSPVVVRLTRWGMPKLGAVLVTGVLAFAVIGAVGWVVTSQALNLAQQLPSYDSNMQKKIAALKSPRAPSALARSVDMIENLQKQLQAPAPEPLGASGKNLERQPLPVEVRSPRSGPLELVRSVVSPVLAPLGTAGLVIIFVLMMLQQREDLRDRFIKVASAGKINVATQAVEDAAQRVFRYLGMQLVVNSTYGIPIGIGLYFIGVPNALLWGVLAMLLRFIPFLGPWIAAAFPVALAIAVDPGWDMVLYTITLFIIVELISNNVIEVWLYGSSTGISNLALMIAAVFWTWLWGIPGLFLSTPLTVCVVVLGKYVPALKFLSDLLGSEPVLSPAAQFYQRMLSMDSEEMLDMAVRFVEERSLTEFYDEVFAPALLLSEEDRHDGSLAEVRQKFIFQASRDLVEELERRAEEGKRPDAKSGSGQVLPGPRPPHALILGLPARDEADEVVALMLAHLLRTRGFSVEVGQATETPREHADRLRSGSVALVFVSALPPAAISAARQTCRRLKDQCGSIDILVGIWSREANVSDLRGRLRGAGPCDVVNRLGDAAVQIERRLSGLSPAEPSHPPAQPATTDSTVAPLNWRHIRPEDLLDTVARELAQTFDVPISLVSIIDLDSSFWKSHLRAPSDLVKTLEAAGESSPAVIIGSDRGLLLVEDVAKDRRLSENSFLAGRGIGFYAEASLRTHDGHVVGGLCVVDTKPRSVTDFEKEMLRLRAHEVMEALQSLPEPAGGLHR
jgi:predicted PurR-regulated permease PerM